MSTGTRGPTPTDKLELHSGDRMSREEFHHLYRQMPPEFKAELIGGTVYVASPLKRKHATGHLPLGTVFFLYAARSRGLEAGDNGTILLGEDSEPQPDLYLRILPEFGGQSRTSDDDYVEGPPELVGEIAHSSRALDLHAKKNDYAAHGVIEYVVICVREKEVRWFNLKRGVEQTPDKNGIFRSEVFPGLWIDSRAVLSKDAAELITTLEKGMATAEYAAFVGELQAAGPDAMDP